MSFADQLQEARDPITPKWIKGIRKWWKQWASKKSSYPGRTTAPSGPLPEFPIPIYAEDWSIEGGTDWSKRPRVELWERDIKPGGEAAFRYLDGGVDVVERIRRDLLINKGFFTMVQKKDGPAVDTTDLKVTIAEHLDAATRALKDGRDQVESYVRWTDPDATAHFQMFPETWRTERDFKRAIVAGEVSPLRREFWKSIEFEVEGNAATRPMRILLHLARFGRAMIKI